MKKQTVIYILVVLLFSVCIFTVFQHREKSVGFRLADYASPSKIQKINLNTATADELQVIPGIGPVISERIIQYRSDNGPFASIEEVDNVKGIGPYLLSRLENYTTVGE